MKNDWISIDDEKPELDEEILVATKDGRVHVGMLQWEQGWNPLSWDLLVSRVDFKFVTHWQSLPPHPEMYTSPNKKSK